MSYCSPYNLDTQLLVFKIIFLLYGLRSGIVISSSSLCYRIQSVQLLLAFLRTSHFSWQSLTHPRHVYFHWLENIPNSGSHFVKITDHIFRTTCWAYTYISVISFPKLVNLWNHIFFHIGLTMWSYNPNLSEKIWWQKWDLVFYTFTYWSYHNGVHVESCCCCRRQ